MRTNFLLFFDLSVDIYPFFKKLPRISSMGELDKKVSFVGKK